MKINTLKNNLTKVLRNTKVFISLNMQNGNDMETTNKKGAIAAGESGVKIHLQNGSKTMCHARSFNKEEQRDFIAAYKSTPGICCEKCAAYLKQRGKI